jgi:hypothetical protein
MAHEQSLSFVVTTQASNASGMIQVIDLRESITVIETLKQILLGSRIAINEQQYAEKLAGLEELLGPRYDDPDDALGWTDMWSFTDCLPGTALATNHLIQLSSVKTRWQRHPIPYELVAFTRQNVARCDTGDDLTTFQTSARRIAYVLETVGRYSTVDTLKPGSCCEMPARKGMAPGYLVFLEYTCDNKSLTITGRTYSLLLCVEVFAAEMTYARTNGVAALVEKLVEGGYYPYSDLDRPSVV